MGRGQQIIGNNLTWQKMLRETMAEIRDYLSDDPVIAENKAIVTYTLDHPSKRIVNAVTRFRIQIQPSGWSQTVGAGGLDLQWFFWITIKYKPATSNRDVEEQLTYLASYITERIHRAWWAAGLRTYFAKALVNYNTVKLTTNSREITLPLADDEIATTLSFWADRGLVENPTPPGKEV